MTVFVLRRALGVVPLLVGVSMILFGLLQAIPGGPLAVYLNNPFVTGRELAALRQEFGLDQPLHVQYLRWFGAYALGHWGVSYSSGQPVAALIAARLPA